MIIQLCFLLFCFVSLTLCADEKEEAPLFAGNIIAYWGVTTEPGEFNIETLLYLTRINGFYNKDSKLVSDLNVHQNQIEVEFSLGLIKDVDLTLELYGYHIHNNGKDAYEIGDTDVFLGFQLLKDKKNTLIPNVRFLVGWIFPTGKYDALNERFNGADGTGAGAYSTFITFIASKIFHGAHPLNVTLNIYYILSSRVDIEGRNIYIFDPGVRGEVQPGVQFDIDLAFEYKFNRPWGIGMDIFFQQQNSSSFQSSSAPLPAIPSTYSLSLAPSIEYNFSEKMNMLAGSWFTVAGRNVFSFRSFVFGFYRAF